MPRHLHSRRVPHTPGPGGRPFHPRIFNESMTYLFDQGSGPVAAEDANIRVTPTKHWNGQWAWWAFRASAYAGLIPHVLLAKANHYNMVANEHLGFYGTDVDTDTWTKFDTQTIGAVDLDLVMATALPAGTLYFSALPMYPFSRVQRKVAEWSAAANVSSPASATAFIIGNATSRDAGDSSDRTAPPLPYYGLKVTNASGYTKNKAILTAYNHPSETPGAYQLEGLMTWLLAEDPLAKFLCDWFELYVYPCLNPQGVWAGYFRSNPAEPATDHNRHWNAAGHEDCDAFLAAFTADTGGAAEVGLDFHAWMDAWAHKGYSFNGVDANVVEFVAQMTAYNAAFLQVDDNTASMLANVWKASYGTSLHMTLEAGGLDTKGIADWKNYGKWAGQSLANMLAKGLWTNGPGVGSRDCSGTTDRIDWAAIWDPAGQPLTISAWVNIDALVPTNQYILCIHDAGDASYGLVLNFTNTVLINFIRHAATGDHVWFNNGVPPTGAWRHLLVTSDGGLIAASVALYINGANLAASFNTGAFGAETAHAGSLSIAGRIYSDTRNVDGKLAQVRVFDRVLTAAEIALEAAGIVTTTSGLKFYFKGNTADLHDQVTSAEGTADGTAQLIGAGNGPAIVYP